MSSSLFPIQKEGNEYSLWHFEDCSGCYDVSFVYRLTFFLISGLSNMVRIFFFPDWCCRQLLHGGPSIPPCPLACFAGPTQTCRASFSTSFGSTQALSAPCVHASSYRPIPQGEWSPVGGLVHSLLESPR